MRIRPRGVVRVQRSWTRIINQKVFIFTIIEYLEVVQIVVVYEYPSEAVGWESETIHNFEFPKKRS